MKKKRSFMEGPMLKFAYSLFSILPVSVASGLGGWLGRIIGPRLKMHRTAQLNFAKALPEHPHMMIHKSISGMWDNIGRTMAEYPHLRKIALERTEIEGYQHVKQALSEYRSIIFVGAHMANWEVPLPACILQKKLIVHPVYRAPNNPVAEKLLERARALHPKITFIPKSPTGVKLMMQQLKSRKHIGMLVDQKQNTGIPVPFFGHPAMTTQSFVQLAQKTGAAIIPVRCERLPKARFRITVYEEILTQRIKKGRGKNRGKEELVDKDAESVIREFHTLLESWILENPKEWLWVHGRWDSSRLNDDDDDEEEEGFESSLDVTP